MAGSYVFGTQGGVIPWWCYKITYSIWSARATGINSLQLHDHHWAMMVRLSFVFWGDDGKKLGGSYSTCSLCNWLFIVGRACCEHLQRRSLIQLSGELHQLTQQPLILWRSFFLSWISKLQNFFLKCLCCNSEMISWSYLIKELHRRKEA